MVDRFGLAGARVLEATADAEVLAGVGRLAAGWLDETLRDGQVVALSWGQTLQAMVAAVDGPVRRDVEVVQLVGGLSALDSALTGQELVRELSERLGARHRYLHAPALLGSAEARDMLLREPAIAGALDAAKAPTSPSSASARPASGPRGPCSRRSGSAPPNGPRSTPPGPWATSAGGSTTCPAARCAAWSPTASWPSPSTTARHPDRGRGRGRTGEGPGHPRGPARPHHRHPHLRPGHRRLGPRPGPRGGAAGGRAPWPKVAHGASTSPVLHRRGRGAALRPGGRAAAHHPAPAQLPDPVPGARAWGCGCSCAAGACS